MEQFGNVDQLLASLNRLVEEDVEPVSSKEDRIKNIEESLQTITSSVNEINQRTNQIVELCCSQGQLFAKIYHRSEAANKETESQLKDIKKQITHLFSQLQTLVHIGSYGEAGAGLHAAIRPLTSAQHSPVSAGVSRSPIISSAFVPAITAKQVQNVTSIPPISQRNADAVIQSSISAHDGFLGISSAPMVTAARSGVSMLQSDLSLQAHQQQFQLLKQQQQPQLNLFDLSESNKYMGSSPPMSKPPSGADAVKTPQTADQQTSTQKAAVAFFQQHNQQLPGLEPCTCSPVSDGLAPLAASQSSESNSDNTHSVQKQKNEQQNVPPAPLNNPRTSPAVKHCLDTISQPAKTNPPVLQPVPEISMKPASKIDRSTAEEISKSTRPNVKPTTSSKPATLMRTSGSSNGQHYTSSTSGNGKSVAESLPISNSSTAYKNKSQSTRKESDTSEYPPLSRSHDRTSHRSRSPPARRTESHAEPPHSSSRSEHLREISPPRMHVTIKGATKHYRDIDSTPERPPNKRRHTSPRISGNTIPFLSDSGSDSGLDIDDLIEKRFSNTESSSRRNGRNGRDIGIVGASSSIRDSNSSNSNGSASKSQIAIRSKPRSQSPVTSRHGRDGDYDKYNRVSNAEWGAGDRYVPGDSHHTSNRFSDSRDINSRLNLTSPRNATAIPLRDSDGQPLTSERISRIMGPFLFIGTPMISPLYKMFYGCQALSTGVKPYELNKAITGLDGFKFWSTTNAQSDGSYNRFLAFVQRDGPDFDRQQRRINKRLLGGRFVLGPLLCYFVATLAIVNISTLTGNLIKYMFRKVMRRPIETLNVVTKDGIAQLSADQIADMTYKWLIGITGYIHSNSRAPESLDKADRCYRIYIAQCRNSDSSIDNMDSDGEIARDMLATDREKSQLFLGIRSSDLQQLYKYLVQMMSGSVSVPVVTYLRHVSESYIEKE